MRVAGFVRRRRSDTSGLQYLTRKSCENFHRMRLDRLKPEHLPGVSAWLDRNAALAAYPGVRITNSLAGHRVPLNLPSAGAKTLSNPHCPRKLNSPLYQRQNKESACRREENTEGGDSFPPAGASLWLPAGLLRQTRWK